MNGEIGNDQAVVLINRHEPEGEATTRLLEIAREKGYDDSVVVAQRGEHDVPLSWRVPADVAEAFDADRDGRWPTDEEVPPGTVNGDAYAADQARAAQQAGQAAADANTDGDPKVRQSRPGKKQ